MLNKLYAYFETDLQAIIREGLEVILEDRDPLINFADYNLSRDVNDDHLIASIIMLRDEKPDAQIFLVTSDSGLMLLAKAKRHGIQSVKLSDNFKLKEEPDPDQEKIKELEQELEKLKRTIPNLSLEFEDHNQYKTFTIGSPLEITENEIAVRIAALKLKYPKIEPPEDITKNNNTPLAELLDSVEGRSLLWNTVSSEDIGGLDESGLITALITVGTKKA